MMSGSLVSDYLQCVKIIVIFPVKLMLQKLNTIPLNTTLDIQINQDFLLSCTKTSENNFIKKNQQ